MSVASRSVGALVKSTDLVTEADLRTLCPPAIRLHVTRVQLEPGEDPAVFLAKVDAAAAIIRDTAPELVLFACASATFAGGTKLDDAVNDRIQRIAGCEAVTAGSAMVQAARRLGLRNVLLVTPYTDAIDQAIVETLGKAGVAVAAILSVRYSEIFQPAFLASIPGGKNRLVDPEWLHRLTLERLKGCAGVDGIAVACTGLRVSEVIADLERDAGVPVIAANQSMAAEAQRRLGLAIPVAGYGRLLSLTIPLP